MRLLIVILTIKIIVFSIGKKTTGLTKFPCPRYKLLKCPWNPCLLSSCPTGTKCLPNNCGGCTRKCVKDSGWCRYRGKILKVNEIFRKGCNRCACGIKGIVTCRNTFCPTCKYNGKWYKPQQWFTAKDGCNRCSCRPNGNVSCTRKSCKP